MARVALKSLTLYFDDRYFYKFGVLEYEVEGAGDPPGPIFANTELIDEACDGWSDLLPAIERRAQQAADADFERFRSQGGTAIKEEGIHGFAH